MVAGLYHFIISSFRLTLWHGEKTPRKKIKARHCHFYFSPGAISSFRFFAWRFFVISSFQVAFFVFSPRHNVRRKDETTKWHEPAIIVNSEVIVSVLSLLSKPSQNGEMALPFTKVGK